MAFFLKATTLARSPQNFFRFYLHRKAFVKEKPDTHFRNPIRETVPSAIRHAAIPKPIARFIASLMRDAAMVLSTVSVTAMTELEARSVAESC